MSTNTSANWCVQGSVDPLNNLALPSQPNARLHFGATIALQAFSTNKAMVVKNCSDPAADGKLVACPLDQHKQPDVILFKVGISATHSCIPASTVDRIGRS